MVYDKLRGFRHVISGHFAVRAYPLGRFHFDTVGSGKILEGIVGSKQDSTLLRNLRQSFLGVCFQLFQFLLIGFFSFFDNRFFLRKLFFQSCRHGGDCLCIQVLVKPKMGIRHIFSLEGLNDLILREVLGNHDAPLCLQGILHFPLKM